VNDFLEPLTQLKAGTALFIQTKVFISQLYGHSLMFICAKKHSVDAGQLAPTAAGKSAGQTSNNLSE
jgi:hypothetical protein